MRARLLTMLIASLALHIVIVGGIVFSLRHRGHAHVVGAAPAGVARMILMRPSELPMPKKRALGLVSGPSLSSATPSLPTPSTASLPAPHSVEKPVPLEVTKTIPEANPNAHLPVPAPEAILNPTPPPILDAATGVVFVLDISGSMYEPYAGSTRLTYARQLLGDHIRALKNGTPFAVVLYARNARASGPLVAASDATREAAVRFILREVDCGGGTNLPAGLAEAEHLHAGDLVLFSDGDLNTTAQNLSTRAREILGDGKHGSRLEIFGIAPRPAQSAAQLLQSLAAEQGGTYQAEESDGDTGLISSRASASQSQ